MEEKGREEALLYWQKRALAAERKVRRLQKEKEEEEASGEHKKVELIEFIPPHVHPVKESEKEEEVQEEEEKAPKWRKMMPRCKVLMDPEVLLKLISSFSSSHCPSFSPFPSTLVIVTLLLLFCVLLPLLLPLYHPTHL